MDRAMDPQKYKWPLMSCPETLCCVALHLPSTKTLALPYACALALGCLASLLVPPSGALGDEVHLQQSPEPRVASWFANFGNINKYVEKLFSNSSKKSKNHKESSNSTNSTPSNTTASPPLNVTKPPPRNTQRIQSARPPQAPAISLRP